MVECKKTKYQFYNAAQEYHKNGFKTKNLQFLWSVGMQRNLKMAFYFH